MYWGHAKRSNNHGVSEPQEAFLWWGGGEAKVKMLATMIDQRRKIKKNIG